jgi:hypothetical protein
MHSLLLDEQLFELTKQHYEELLADAELNRQLAKLRPERPTRFRPPARFMALLQRFHLSVRPRPQVAA